jgi:predicted Zn-dependent protease
LPFLIETVNLLLPMRVILAIALVVLLGCATAPYTGRSQFLLVSEGQETGLGEDAYRHILRDSVLTDNQEAERIVRKVGERIARVANKADYKWEFRVINDPEMTNAFAVPGGKVAVYTGMFPVARDETGLAVVLGHEIAHALLRHPGERMSREMLVQLGGLGLAGALGGNPQLAGQVLQAYGLGANVGVILPFGRSQESEADKVGLMLMAKAGYDPRPALDLWERMERKERGGSAPEFLSTHPSYETRTQQLRGWIPEALRYYQPVEARVETLPSLQELDSPTARAERELLKRIQALNKKVGEAGGERAVVEALGYALRVNPSLVYRERQQAQLGYGQYAALRGVSHLASAPISRVAADYQRGVRWATLADANGGKLTDLISWMGELLRTTGTIQRQLSR